MRLNICLLSAAELRSVLLTHSAMADPSRRIIYGIHALRSRFTLLRESPIFSPIPGSLKNAEFSSISSNAIADRELSSLATLIRSSSRSGIFHSPSSNSGQYRGFCSWSNRFLPYFRQRKVNFSSGFKIRSQGGSIAESSVFRDSLKSRFSSQGLSSVASRYRAAVGLQMEAFWRTNYLVLVGVVGVFVWIALWRLMFGVASTFVGLSEGMAKYGFLALASAIVAFSVSALRIFLLFLTMKQIGTSIFPFCVYV